MHVIGFDLCEACHANPKAPRHPYPLVRRPAPTDGTEAPRVATRLTPGGGGVLLSLQVAPAGAERAAARSALRDLRLLEGLWMNRRDAAAPNPNPLPHPNPSPNPKPNPNPNPNP